MMMMVLVMMVMVMMMCLIYGIMGLNDDDVDKNDGKKT